MFCSKRKTKESLKDYIKQKNYYGWLYKKIKK